MAEKRLPTVIQGLVIDARASLTFLTRLPTTRLGPPTHEPPDFRRASRMFPLIGAAIGALGGLVLVVAILLGVPPIIAACLAVATTMIVTGGLHEDGLGDTMDGFGGGGTLAKKLAIMRDSSIGSYGAAALMFSILIRVAALWSLAIVDPWSAGLALVGAEALSRAAMTLVWRALPSARTDGIAHDAGPPDAEALLTAVLSAIGVCLIAVWPSAGSASLIAGILLAAMATYIFTIVSRAQIGGRTGDTLGACQQIAAVSFLIGVASAL